MLVPSLANGCDVSWDAWVAFATLGAVFVALPIADKQRRDCEMAERAERFGSPPARWPTDHLLAAGHLNGESRSQWMHISARLKKHLKP